MDDAIVRSAWMRNMQKLAEMTNSLKSGNRMDCTPEFIGAMANAVYVGSMHRVRLIAPFTYLTKADVVTRAALVDAPLHLTWSCYAGGANGLQCGVCPTCRERIKAFAEAGFADPVPYANGQNWDNFEAWPTTIPF